MGLLSWWRQKEPTPADSKPKQSSGSKQASSGRAEDETSGLNGAVEVRRPGDATVFEFGASSGVTIAGYCPVSDELEPCRWEILPSTGDNAPQFRVQACGLQPFRSAATS